MGTSEASASDGIFNLYIWTKMRVGHSTCRTPLDRGANAGAPMSDRLSVVALPADA
jgi:hypothetical protein